MLIEYIFIRYEYFEQYRRFVFTPQKTLVVPLSAKAVATRKTAKIRKSEKLHIKNQREIRTRL